MEKALLISLLSLLLFLSCTGGVSGTTTETTGEYAGIVLNPDSTPSVDAKVALYNTKTNSFDVEAYTEADGRFTIKADTTETYHLSITSSDSSAVSWLYFPLQSDEETIDAVLSSPASCSITLQDAPEGRELFLASSPYSATVTSSQVAWQNIPEGSYTLCDSIGGELVPLGSFYLEADSISHLALQYNSKGILFDDFNDGDENPILYPLNYHPLPWFYKEDTLFESFVSRLEEDSAGGYYLHIAESNQLRKAITKIGEDIDLSELDSVTFRAKGEGILRFAFEDKYDTPEDSLKKILFKTTLTPNWQEYTIDVQSHSDFDVQLLSSWSDVKTSVDYITLFMYPTEKELWIDDIRLYGIDVKSLIGK